MKGGTLMDIYQYLKNNKPIDKIGNYLQALNLADKINNTLSLCKTKVGLTNILQNVSPKMDVVATTAMSQHPEHIKVRALLP